MKKLALSLIFILCLFALAGCGQSEIQALEPAPTPELSVKLTASIRTDSVGVPALITDEHVSYLTELNLGRIFPDADITRADACQAIYALMADPVKGSCSFSDVSEDDDFYDAVCCLCAWGVISDSDGAFNPDSVLTRAQLVTMLSAFYPPEADAEAPYVGSFLRHDLDVDRLPDLSMPSFTDTSDHWASVYIENAVTRGWIDAGGKFRPDKAVTRGEFCHIVNRMLNRTCDTPVLALTGQDSPYSDLPATHSYFGDIMEASCEHSFYYIDGLEYWRCENLDAGLHRINGKLCYVQEDGTLLRNATLEQWTFDEQGYYTTGLAELDDMITSIFLELGTDDMSDEEALRAAFLYCTHDHIYIYHDADAYHFDGVTSVNALRALLFFKAGGGYCYDYAAAFGLLARSLGYNCYIVYAEVNEYYAPHGFVVIPENGINYIYDPELESARPERHADFGLFRIQNYAIYDYWYTPWW